MSEDVPPVYSPGEDTFLLIEVLAGYQGERSLEIGFGSGAVLASLMGRFSTVVGTDLISLEKARGVDSGGAAIILADRASCFRDGTFDLVCFNPPYLPSEGVEDRAVDGGLGGIEVPAAFLKEALRVLRADGRVLILLSDLGSVREFVLSAENQGLRVVEKARRRLFYETLVVFEVSRGQGTAELASPVPSC